MQVPSGPWFCRKCESQERAARVVSFVQTAHAKICPILAIFLKIEKHIKSFLFLQRCELCPNRDGALKRTDTNSWAHVVCALYIPEVRFHNVSTMEPIVLGLVPPERYGNVMNQIR